MSVEEAVEAREGAHRAGVVLVGLLAGVIVFLAIAGAFALRSATATANHAADALDAALDDSAVTACRTEQRAAIDQAIADKAAGDALLTRIRTEYDIANASGLHPQLAPFIDRARQALADIDAAVARQAAATDVYDRGATQSRIHPRAFLEECRR